MQVFKRGKGMDIILFLSRFLMYVPIVCRILFDKYCILPISKKISHVKKVHHQLFDIIHLSNPELTFT
jgi:hypothetical protein